MHLDNLNENKIWRTIIFIMIRLAIAILVITKVVGCEDVPIPSYLNITSAGEIPDETPPPHFSNRSKRMTAGEKAWVTAHPYIVSFVQNDTYVCTGSIVRTKIILTASSCIKKLELPYVKVRAGSSRIDHGGTLFDVERFILHPYYQGAAFGNIALAILKEPLKYNDFIRNILLFKPGEFVAVNDMVTLVGWGWKNQSEPFVQLREIDVRIVHFKRHCVKKLIVDSPWLPLRTFYPGQFCTDTYAKGICQKNGGTPVIHKRMRLVGILSYITGWDDCTTGFDHPIVYTDIQYFRDWIEHIFEEVETVRPKETQTTTQSSTVDVNTPKPTPSLI